MTHWLEIVGIGEDGLDGLAPATRAVVEAAEVIVGGDRHHTLSAAVNAERVAWPSPFDAMIDTILDHRGRRIVILVTGDPLWYSVGARILKAIPSDEIRFHPQLSAFQLAACRMGWSLADVETLTVHGRHPGQAAAFFAPGARLLILAQDSDTPAEIARRLTAAGYGESTMTVLAAMGGSAETRLDGTAAAWRGAAPAFHTLAVACAPTPGARTIPPGIGLPDDVFEHDGQITKAEVRAVTLAALRPMRHALLWDIGIGAGSVAIEWMRAARDAEAIGLDPNSERRAMAARNADRLGAPRLRLLDARAPEGLADLPRPDAVFVGGGLSEATVEAALSALKPMGRLVANAVTLESEALLAALSARHGGSLRRIGIDRAGPVGARRGWRPAMPVTQWVIDQ
ncbi:MAG: precorrin-6y C5,15-methyltransferase (decarboxylating) subunit CbiE [Pseudomonadota bacterium]